MMLVSQAAQDSNHSGNETAAAGLCCYSGPTDCDGERDYCSKNEANCAECGGSLVVLGSSSQTAPERGNVVVMSAQGVQAQSPQEAGPGLCCYSGPMDCDSSRDFCSKTEANCAVCGGLMHSRGSSSKTVFKESANSSSKQMAASGKAPMEKSPEPMVLVSQAAQDSNHLGNGTAAAGLCCYSGPTDCDGERDYCSKDEANCAEGGGSLVVPESSSRTAPTEGSVASKVTGAFLAAQGSPASLSPAWLAVAAACMAVVPVLVLKGRGRRPTVNMPAHALG